ncbi:MAG: hypothetical protein K0S23_653 [Fluviicola sp.]|jgi:hypothetical protein|nr:hypothetical protein [Fluviicola sp.]
MEKTGNPKYLRVVTIILLIVYVLFMLMNFLKGIWDWTFYFGNGELNSLIRIKNYMGKFHLVIYVVIYIMEIIFLLVLNRLVKKYGIGKGYHFLIILLSFLPVANCFLFYIIKRKLNKQLFTYSEMSVRRSDLKIVTTWVLMILFIIYTFLIPLLMFYVVEPELVSRADYYLHFSVLVTDCYFLITSLICLLYYLEFKQMLNKMDLTVSGIGNTPLLDN